MVPLPLCGPAGSARKPVQTLVLLLMLLALLPAAAHQQPARLQPALVQLAASAPNALVDVIVQRQGAADALPALVRRLGGEITTDLSIINAFGARLPAATVVELARAPGVRWVSLDAPVAQSGLLTSFTSWATTADTAASTGFTDLAALADSPLGPNGTYGVVGRGKGVFSGFDTEISPGSMITRVELLLHAYVPSRLGAASSPRLSVAVDGAYGLPVLLPASTLDRHIGQANAGLVSVDVTYTRLWRWADFTKELKLQLDQSRFPQSRQVHYDAVGLRVTSLPDPRALMPTVRLPAAEGGSPIATSQLRNTYNFAVRASEVWNQAPYLQGQGVTVAVVDSGVARNNDLSRRLLGSINFHQGSHSSTDRYGHGTFIAGIIAGDGRDSKGERIGIAPKANILNVRISDDQGMSTESDVVAALQWLYEHRRQYNVRVVNLSFNATVPQSYHTSPLAAAAEILWFNGLVVVVSSGNNGSASPGVLMPPANDPFVITVGASDDQGSSDIGDDTVTAYSAYGVTTEGYSKPELVAPGTDIIAPLPHNRQLTISRLRPGNRVDNHYFRMSGTSMAAPMVSGAVAILLQDEPQLTPDQVKFRLMETAARAERWPGYDPLRAGAGYLDIYAAVNGTSTASANTGLPASQLLWTGSDPVSWGSVNWGSVNWGSVNWGSVNWGSVNWGSVNWGSDYWDE
jgi:serine protease AprX